METNNKDTKQKNTKKKKKKNKKKKTGFTNRLGVYLVSLLLLGLIGGFYLALKSIEHEYSGSLLCWTVVFTPIGTALSIVLAKIVDKSKAENTGADGTGIKFATALANNFQEDYEIPLDNLVEEDYNNDFSDDVNSPSI